MPEREKAFIKWFEEEGVHRFPGGEMTFEEWEWIARDIYEDAYLEGWKAGIID